MGERRRDRVLRHVELKNPDRWTPGRCGGADSRNTELSGWMTMSVKKSRIWKFRQFGDSPIRYHRVCAERSTLRKFPHRQFHAQHSALSDRPPSKHSNAMSHMCLHIRHYFRHSHSLETFITDNASHFPLPTFSSFSAVNSLNLSTFNI